MGLETGVTYLGDLVSANPTGTDPKGQGDDHIRNTKRAAKQSFAGFTGAVMVTGPESGLANAYVLTPVPALPSYVAGMSVTFMASNANTGASTLNISGLGVKALKGPTGEVLLANEIETNGFVNATYDGTRFLLKAPTKEWIEQLALSGVLPSQTGNDGKFLKTNAGSASWDYAGITGVVTKSANYTVAVTDREKLIDCTGTASFALTLPSAFTAGPSFAFYAQASGSGTITFTPNGSDTVNLSTIRPGDSCVLFCDGTSAWRAFISRRTAAEDTLMFGDGFDGNVTVTGSVTLTRDMYYDTLTLGSGAVLVTNGWRIFCKTALDLSGAPAGAISWNGSDGAAASGTDGGNPGASLSSGFFGGTYPAAGAGAGAPSGVAVPGDLILGNGGKGGANGVTGRVTGIIASVPVNAAVNWPVRSPIPTSGLIAYNTASNVSNDVRRLCGGGTGTSGNRHQTVGGGGAPTGGGALAIYARTIIRGVGTAIAAIQAKGGIGGAGSPLGGGGGAGGGGGGWIVLVYRFLSGVAATGLVDVTGGNGGAGGAGQSSQGGGDGGYSGEGGRIQAYNIETGVLTEVTPVASVSGTQSVGDTAGVGGAATTSRMTL